MFRKDLKAAGIARIDENGNVPMRIAMGIMRHSEIRLTTKTYTDHELLSVKGAIDNLPSVLPKNPERSRETNDGDGALKCAHDLDANGHELAPSVTTEGASSFAEPSEDEGFWRELAQIDALGQNDEMVASLGFEADVISSIHAAWKVAWTQIGTHARDTLKNQVFEILKAWPKLTPEFRTAIMAIVRSCTSGL